MGLFDRRKKKYENGDVYIGKVKNGKPDIASRYGAGLSETYRG